MTVTKSIDQMIEEIPISQRVRNGARWLDETVPGWRDRIDRVSLRLDSGFHCICGQVFNDVACNLYGTVPFSGLPEVSGYNYAYDTLFSEANSWIEATIPKVSPYRAKQVAAFLGFDVPDNCDRPMALYKVLQNEWVRFLNQPA